MEKIINLDLINLDLKSNTKEEVIRELALLINGAKRLTDVEGFIGDVFKRENEMTTGMGNGLAIPHAQSEFVKVPTLVFGRTNNAIDYKSIDGNDVDIFFMIAVPKASGSEHLVILQNLARKMLDETFVNLLRTGDKDAILQAIDSISNPEEKVATKGKVNIVAISNCPAGIAHTYMVAEQLEKKCSAAGMGIKVETQGANGVENKLSSKDIMEADYVILALGRGLTDSDKKTLCR